MRDKSDRKRILAAVILIFSGAAMITSYQSAAIALNSVIGAALLLIGVSALVRKPNRAAGPIATARIEPPAVRPSAAPGAVEMTTQSRSWKGEKLKARTCY